MHAEDAVKTWAKRFWSLGYSRVALVLAIVFAIIALATPLWAITLNEGPGHWTTATFSWTGVTSDEYRNGVFDSSTYQPYSAPSFDMHLLSSAITNSYIIILFYIILLVVVVSLFSLDRARIFPRILLIVISIATVLMALFALFYPLAVVPGAATTDMGETINGFWGSLAVPSLTWGAGLGWWLLLIAAILGCLGAALPYVKSMRTRPMAAPQPWHPSR